MVKFHPTAEVNINATDKLSPPPFFQGILATVSYDLTIKIWSLSDMEVAAITSHRLISLPRTVSACPATLTRSTRWPGASAAASSPPPARMAR